MKPGESYKPLLSSDEKPLEVTPYSVILGLLMTILFSAAAAFLGLKVGQVFEAAIPISIIAVGVTGALGKKGGLGQNVIIQSIGACSGVVVAGAIFTLPAIYILGLDVNFWQMFLSSALGGFLGILFLVPFRKYFVKDMHGKYPFPEATASTQVLISGERSGSQAKPLLVAGIVGGLFDFAVAAFGAWNENFTSRCCEFGSTVADKAKLVFSINTSAALLGMGYIVGLKYAAIICFGSIAVWWIIVPGIALIFPDLMVTEGITATAASPEQIFGYAKSIGIGGIAMAGIIGVIKSWGVIKSAFSLVGQIFKGGNANEEVERTQRDISMKIIAIGSLLTIIITALFFYFDVMGGNLLFTIVGILIVAIIAFLFTTVAANAIAIVGSNPVSGMTLMTLILSSIIMVVVGLKGTGGMVAALIMGGVVSFAAVGFISSASMETFSAASSFVFNLCSLDIIDTNSTSAPAKLMFDGHTVRFFIAVSCNVSSIAVSPTNTSYTDSSNSFVIPNPLVAFPCGSVSISNTFFPFFASIVLKLTVVVVLPTPPF